jgi:O-methyltransferase involved in polyketide biosynthesis
VALDLSDVDKRRELFASLAVKATRVLVLTEGLLIYLTPEANGALAEDLAAQPNFTNWIFDLASPALLEYMRQRTGQHTEKAGAPFIFAPANGPEFFEPHGWNALQAHSVFETAKQTNRVPEELQAFAGFKEPPKPWTLPMPWSGVCLMQRKL